MILAVTLNPSVDMLYTFENLKLNSVNRIQKVYKSAGGKGLNVARVVHLLDGQVLATGFVGGTTGDYIKKDLSEASIGHDFTDILGESRHCLAVIHAGNQTEILESGPHISSDNAKTFLKHYKALLKKSDLVVISGSLSAGLDNDYYCELIGMANSQGKKVLLDTSGLALEQVLMNEHKPFFIKPNTEELSSLIGYQVAKDIPTLKSILNKNIFKGIEIIMISMGADGAFVKWGDTFYDVTVPKIDVVNPVGSGDATVAGVAVALDDGMSKVLCLKQGMTSGLLNALESRTGFINQNNFTRYMDKIKVTELK